MGGAARGRIAGRSGAEPGSGGRGGGTALSSPRRRLRRTLRVLEQRTVEALRHPAVRAVGLVLGVVALGFLVFSLVRAGDEAWAALRGQDLASLGLMLAGFAVFQLTGLLSLRALGGRPAGRIWAAAQLSKYLPVPGSAGFGMVGSIVHYGHSARAAMGYLIRHSLLLVGAALAVAAPIAGDWAAGYLPVGAGPFTAALVAVGLVGAYVSIVSYPARGRWAALAIAVGGWALGAAAIGIGFGAGTGLGAGDGLLLGATFAAGWVVGQLVVPVPAGIGVREAAILWFAAPLVGSEAALAYALLTRVLHVVVDGGLVAAVAVRRGASPTGDVDGA